MKIKLLFSTALLFFAGLFMGFAQTENRFGAMIAYGTEIENIGIGVNAEFPIMEDLTISPSFIYYFPKEDYGVKLNWWELNANANYYFLNNESLGFYGLAGINYSHVKVDFDGFAGMPGIETEASDGKFGLNLGAGANFNIGSGIIPFAEAKYVIIDEGQLVLAAGVKFNL